MYGTFIIQVKEQLSYRGYLEGVSAVNVNSSLYVFSQLSTINPRFIRWVVIR